MIPKSTESKIPDAGGGSIKKTAPSLSSVQSMTTPQLPMQSVTPPETTQLPAQSVNSQTTQLPIKSVITFQTTQLPAQSVNSQMTQLPIQSVATPQTTQLPMQSVISRTTHFLTQSAGAPQSTQLPMQSVATSQTTQLPAQSVNSQSTQLPVQSVATSQTTQLPMQSVNSQTTTQFLSQSAGAPQSTQLPIQSVIPQNTQLHLQSVSTSQTTQLPAQSVASQITQLPVQSVNTPQSNTLLPSTASTLPVPALNSSFLKPPMQLGSMTAPPPKPGPFKSIAMPGPFRPTLFVPPGPFKPPSLPGPFKPTSVPVPFKPTSSSKAMPPRPNPFKCSSVLPAPKVAMTGAMMSRPTSLNQNHKMIPTHPTAATLMPPLPPRNNAVIMPPANQTISARSMMCSRIPMPNNRMMMSGPAPSSIGQLNTSTTLKKTKKKRGRVKRSFKEFERGKAGDNGPSPKFRRIGKTSKDDDKNNHTPQSRWSKEPDFTVVRVPRNETLTHSVSLARF